MTDLIIKEFESIKSAYPGLKLGDTNDFLKGSIDLFDLHTGEKYDTYQVKIMFPSSFPFCFPKVWEIGNKIPRIPERHVNEDGVLCLGVIQEEILYTRNGITLKEFLEKVLKPHLSRETYYVKKRKYPHGEYSHGIDGVLEFFYEKFDTTDPLTVINILTTILEKKLPERNERKCICGSSKKFKKCHLGSVEEVGSLGRERLILLRNKIIDHKKLS